MTFRRDLKRRIRERQEKTGERYTTARAHVLATPPAPSWVVELHDVTEQARLAGLTCPVRVTSALQRSGELQTVLEQLRRILLGPVEGVQVMQRVALRGQPDPWHGDGPVVIVAAHAQRFQERLQHGLRGNRAGPDQGHGAGGSRGGERHQGNRRNRKGLDSHVLPFLPGTEVS